MDPKDILPPFDEKITPDAAGCHSLAEKVVTMMVDHYRQKGQKSVNRRDIREMCAALAVSLTSMGKCGDLSPPDLCNLFFTTLCHSYADQGLKYEFTVVPDDVVENGDTRH